MAETTQRVLRLLTLLQSRPVWTGTELAERLGVTTRSIRRDVERLRDLGYPVHATQGVGGGYQLGAGKALPPLLLDDEEAVAVAVCLRLAAGGSVAGLGEVAVRTLAKLDQVLPKRLRAEVEAVAASTVTVEYGGEQVDAQTLVLLARACRAQMVTTFDYEPVDGPRDRRRVEPYRMVAAGRRWYLMAYDVDRADWRSFRLDRMRRPHQTTFRFAGRDAPDAAEFVQRGMTQAPYEHVARVRVHAPAADVAARVPPTVAEIQPETDATCVLVAGGNDLDGMAWHLAGVGFQFDVLEPPELLESVRSLANRLVAAARLS
jgi:predicted DNA-binding transcriptional regulator YafY